MKKIMSIVESLVLAVLIVALGGGVALTTCCCDNTTGLTLVPDRDGCSMAMDDAADDCCETGQNTDCGETKACKAMPTKSCMSMKVFTLSPMLSGGHAVFHFLNIPHLLANIVWRPIIVMIPRVSLRPMWWERTAFVSPPRAFLHLLRVLTI